MRLRVLVRLLARWLRPGPSLAEVLAAPEFQARVLEIVNEHATERATTLARLTDRPTLADLPDVVRRARFQMRRAKNASAAHPKVSRRSLP